MGSLWLVLASLAATAAEPDPAGLELFEKKIRPVLVEHCYECHSAAAEKVQGGLLLDSRAGIRRGGDSGPAVVPGDVAESLLLAAIRHESFEMPPDGKLPAAVIADFDEWIQSGASDPRDGVAKPVRDEIDLVQGRAFWSFTPPAKPTLPEVENHDWAESEIDRFLLAAMEAHGLQPVGDADRPALLRRVAFDLTGLPPTPEEVDAFVQDPSPDAFENVVDRLLGSPHFGERWGRHWLDVARFAESSGGGRSLMFPDAWRYRDYVIASMNADKPYDRFVIEQIAGDLLPYRDEAEREEQLVATGYLVLGPTNYEEQDKELLRMDVVDEQIDTLGRTFLGMSLGCARCHDHKFDPVPTTDYYGLAGIFRSTRTLTPGNVSGYVQRPLKAGAEKSKPALAMAVQEEDEPGDWHQHIRGGIRNLGPIVPRGFITVATRSTHSAGTVDPPGISPGQSGRLELAHWIASPDNPLTARVMVNRIWHHLFGSGLVRTTDNFGSVGEKPSHPELLDWLAVTFIEDGWSIKTMIRRMMTSHAYQLASRQSPGMAIPGLYTQLDPENRLLSHANRRRLDAESIRDAILAVSGQLDLASGGLTIREIKEYDLKYEFDSVRRSVYVPFFRNSMLDLFEVFDVANPNLVSGRRTASTLPTQALYLMNSPFVLEQSRHAARRLLAEGEPDDRGRMDRMYCRALGRSPTKDEQELALAYLRGNERGTLEPWAGLFHVLFGSLDFRYLY